jgi:cellobiose-specific phosphotransferase system component IIB
MFDFNKYIKENRLGPYSKNEQIGEKRIILNEAYTGVQVPKEAGIPGEEDPEGTVNPDPALVGPDSDEWDQSVDEALSELHGSVTKLLDMGMEPTQVVDFVENFVSSDKLSEADHSEYIDRMDGLVLQPQLQSFTDSIIEMAQDLYQEDFEPHDIERFLTMKLKLALKDALHDF